MRANSPYWTWVGLALLVFGLIVLLLPSMPALVVGGRPPQGAPRMPWPAAAIALVGIIVLLWQRRQRGSGQ